MNANGFGPLRQVSLTVTDVERAVAFYRDVVGLRLIAKFGPLAFFDLGGVRLSVSQAQDAPARNSVLYFAVDDVRAARAELQSRGVRFVDEPHVIFDDHDGVFGEPGQAEWMTFFEDPEGNLLALSARATIA
ncbi:MAG: VOC family protein [Acidimicrobiia bacterium]